MKKIVLMPLVTLALLRCVAPSEGADIEHNKIEYVEQHDNIAQMKSTNLLNTRKTMYSNTSVNMRVSSSTESDIIKTLDCNAKVEVIRKVDSWAYIVHGGEYGFIKYKYLSTYKTEIKDMNRWGIELTPDELDLLAKILFREANLEPYNGQVAVVEVIFNRIVNGTWGSTLYEVLSAPGQFVSWKTRDGAVPTENNYQVIQDVLDGKTSVLSKEYLYFSMGDHASHKGMINIGNHQFCKS